MFQRSLDSTTTQAPTPMNKLGPGNKKKKQFSHLRGDSLCCSLFGIHQFMGSPGLAWANLHLFLKGWKAGWKAGWKGAVAVSCPQHGKHSSGPASAPTSSQPRSPACPARGSEKPGALSRSTLLSPFIPTPNLTLSSCSFPRGPALCGCSGKPGPDSSNPSAAHQAQLLPFLRFS